MSKDPKEELLHVDETLQIWRQGDCGLGEHWFVHQFDPNLPLTEEAVIAGAEGINLAESAVGGLMIVSQTCDIVRSCAERPFIEVCPLIELDENVFRQVERGRRPQYAYVPGTAEHRLVADLDRIMTVEKSVIASWKRTPGCTTDKEVRHLAQALARKRARFAFPDDFTEFVKKLHKRLQEKHDKNSPEGRALRSLREIRVRASPTWDAGKVEITFWFIRDDDTPEFEGKRWDEHLTTWLKLVPSTGRFKKVDGLVAMLEDLTARDYLESDPLDLDHLSTRNA